MENSTLLKGHFGKGRFEKEFAKKEADAKENIPEIRTKISLSGMKPAPNSEVGKWWWPQNALEQM